MDRREFLRLALAAGAVGLVSDNTAAADEPVSLGKLDGFYRGTPLQGHLLSERTALQTEPDFLLRASFPYRKRSYPKKVMAGRIIPSAAPPTTSRFRPA